MTKNKKQTTVDKTGLDMLAQARATAERIGIHDFTRQLCALMRVPFTPSRIFQVRRWLTIDAEKWQHPRAGIVKLMERVK